MLLFVIFWPNTPKTFLISSVYIIVDGSIYMENKRVPYT